MLRLTITNDQKQRLNHASPVNNAVKLGDIIQSVQAGGGVTKAANQAASVAADVATIKTDLNALLTKLKAAGLMVAD